MRPEGSINHLAEYLLRMPFSLQKIHWNEITKTVIYRSRKHWRTKRNFEVFQATDFIAAAVQHIPPKGQQALTKEWIPVDNPEDEPDWFDQSNPWRPREILHDDRILVLDAD